MLRSIRLAVCLFPLLWAKGAFAQFGNQTLGLSIGYLSIVDPTIQWGLPITFEGSYYLESGWETTYRVPLMILTERVNNRQILALGGSGGFRYLFREEGFRPYIGFELSYLHIFRDEGVTNLVGVAPNFGLDVFINDSFSIGARGLANVYWALNEPVRWAPGGQLVLSTHF